MRLTYLGTTSGSVVKAVFAVKNRRLEQSLGNIMPPPDLCRVEAENLDLPGKLQDPRIEDAA